LRIQHKGICMWCPLSSPSAIFFLLPHFAPPPSSTTRFVPERQKRPFVSLCPRPPSFAHNQDSKAGHFHGCHAHRGSNSHQLFPRRALASQGPCVEPSGQQSTPCRGSTTVQRPVLTGKRVVVKHFKPARPTALSHPIA